jgi:hypothetical protein
LVLECFNWLDSVEAALVGCHQAMLSKATRLAVQLTGSAVVERMERLVRLVMKVMTVVCTL